MAPAVPHPTPQRASAPQPSYAQFTFGGGSSSGGDGPSGLPDMPVMPVIFLDISRSRLWLPVDGARGLEMSVSDPCVIRSRGPSAATPAYRARQQLFHRESHARYSASLGLPSSDKKGSTDLHRYGENGSSPR